MTDDKEVIYSSQANFFCDLLVAKTNSLTDENENNTIIADWLEEKIVECKITKNELAQIVKDSHKMDIDEMIISEIKKQIKI